MVYNTTKIKFLCGFSLVVILCYVYYMERGTDSCLFSSKAILCQTLKVRQKETPKLGKRDALRFKLEVLMNKAEVKLSNYTRRKVKRNDFLLKSVSVDRPTHSISDWLNVSEGRLYSNYGDNTCGDSEHKETLSVIFQRWIDITKKLNTPYMLTCGSLLGAWRDQDIVPGDTDMDIYISHKHTMKFHKIRDKRNFDATDNKFHLILQRDWKLPYSQRRRYTCRGKRVKKYRDHCSFEEPFGRLIHRNYHIDIYDYKIENNKLKDPSEFEKEFAVSDIFPVKKCMFMKKQTYCPRKPKVVLEAYYGKDLRPLQLCQQGEWVDWTK